MADVRTVTVTLSDGTPVQVVAGTPLHELYLALAGFSTTAGGGLSDIDLSTLRPMAWFMTPHGPQSVIEPATIAEFRRRDYLEITAQQAADFFANAVEIPDVSFVTGQELPAAVDAVAADPDSPFAVRQRAAFDPAGAAMTRLRAVALGDSTVAGLMKDPLGSVVGVGGTFTFQAPLIGSERAGPWSWFTWACLQSGGRLLNVHNAGVANDTTAGCRARFQTDVVAFRPDVVLISGGVHNDITSGVPTATTRANMVQLIKAARSAGIAPILVTCYPDAGASSTALRLHNAWLKNLAAGRDDTYPEIAHLIVVDPYAAVTDPASSTGGWRTGYTDDGTHANATGAKAAGAKVVADLAGLLRGNGVTGPFAAVDNVQGSPNGFTNPLFVDDSNADGIADYWTAEGPGTTKTLVTDAAVLGKMQRLDVASGALDFYKALGVGSGQFAQVGDRVKWAGLIRVTAAAGGMNWWLQMETNATSWAVQAVPPNQQDCPLAYFECEGIIPSGATSLGAGVHVGSGTGRVEVAQWAMINMTRGL